MLFVTSDLAMHLLLCVTSRERRNTNGNNACSAPVFELLLLLVFTHTLCEGHSHHQQLICHLAPTNLPGTNLPAQPAWHCVCGGIIDGAIVVIDGIPQS